VIAPPLNDQDCLGPTTDQIVAAIEAKNPAIVDLAQQFTNTDDLAAWFRTRPQRDDDGDPDEGPKVDACRPAQRLQFDNPEPNCFERASRFVGAAELIDPDRVYRLATITTPNGLHTFPTRDGEPVILDPLTRNAPRCHGLPKEPIAVRRLRLQRLIGLAENKGLRFDLANARRAKARGVPTWVDGRPIDDAIASYENALANFQQRLADLDAEEAAGSDTETGLRNMVFADASSDPITLTPAQAIDWIAELAMVRANLLPSGIRRVDNGHRAMRGVLVLRPISIADVRDVALALALAEREARAVGLGALKVVHSTARAVDALDQLAAERATTPPRNNPFASLALGALANNKELQSLVGSLARVAGRIASGIGLEAAKVKLDKVGIGAPAIRAFEKELNREGLTLGVLAKPAPLVGSLDAMTPQALAGRWLAQKL
jgi:hypothetical protein